MQINYTPIRTTMQQAIDLIVAKKNKKAKVKLIAADEIIAELIDHADTDEDIIEISRYQVLLNQLHQKIDEVKTMRNDLGNKSGEEDYLV